MRKLASKPIKENVMVITGHNFMSRTRAMIAPVALVVAGASATITLVDISPALASSEIRAAVAECTFVDSAYLDSGVSSAEVDLHRCPDGNYIISGTLWDTADDDRTAYLDIKDYPNGHNQRVEANGNGNSTSFGFSYGPNFLYAELRTRACNTTCSSEATGRVDA